MIEVLRKQVATMQSKLEQKDMQILSHRADVARLTKDNTNLRAKVMDLKEQLIDKDSELTKEMKKASKNGGQRAQNGHTESRASKTDAQQRADDYEKQLIMSM